MFDYADRIVMIACLFAVVFLVGMYAGEAGNTPQHTEAEHENMY